MLINCPECEKKISNYADTCPDCGFPTKVHKALLECPKCGEKERSAFIVKDTSQNRSPNFVYRCAKCGALLNYKGKDGWEVIE